MSIVTIQVMPPMPTDADSLPPDIAYTEYQIPEEAYDAIRKAAVRETIALLKESEALKYRGVDGFLDNWLGYQQYKWRNKGGSHLAK